MSRKPASKSAPWQDPEQYKGFTEAVKDGDIARDVEVTPEMMEKLNLTYWNVEITQPIRRRIPLSAWIRTLEVPPETMVLGFRWHQTPDPRPRREITAEQLQELIPVDDEIDHVEIDYSEAASRLNAFFAATDGE